MFSWDMGEARSQMHIVALIIILYLINMRMFKNKRAAAVQGVKQHPCQLQQRPPGPV